MKFLKWLNTYQAHIFGWTFYMCYETLSIGFALNSFGKPLVYLMHYLVFVLFFYLNALLFLPFALQHGRHAIWRLPFILVFQVAAYIGCQFLVSQLLILVRLTNESTQFYTSYILRNTYRATLYIGFSTGYYFLRTYLHERKRAAELEKDRLNAIIAQQQVAHQLTTAKNALLNAQINPHFLFNTLDFIYQKVHVLSSEAGEAVIRLAEMMRFAMDAYAMDEQVSLMDEVGQVENLLALYHLKHEKQVPVELCYGQEISSFQIIPLILLTLVENMLKHGHFDDPRCIPTVTLKVNHGNLVITTNNATHPHGAFESHQLGLENIRTRLQFAYGDQASFVHQQNDGQFRVEIIIPVGFLKPRA
ncbi:MAG: histidine kinase [Pedobacter sp.]|nr:histidine kinase [Pedobacter sp.]MDQ8052401.1 histidine kinase [Pedobacter sp.]